MALGMVDVKPVVFILFHGQSIKGRPRQQNCEDVIAIIRVSLSFRCRLQHMIYQTSSLLEQSPCDPVEVPHNEDHKLD
jgi:hypothetical protein